MSATSVYEVKNNYPADAKICVKGETYDDGDFVYTCNENGVLCASYCIVKNTADGGYIALTKDERITYDQTGALRCELDGSNLVQVFKDVSAVTMNESKPRDASCK
ncbi:MAG: hypothetical protein Q9M50_14615 [Methylococcales bacterium]|nr:hypothetical protein [Methylococcales bacterium]